jgi:hypothetical protein
LTGEEMVEKKVGAYSLLQKIIIALIVLLVFGFLLDLFSGFYVLAHSKSIYAGLGGLLIVAIFYMIGGEASSEWIGGKDKVTDPLYKRTFHLLTLLLFAAGLLAILWFALKYLVLIRI